MNGERQRTNWQGKMPSFDSGNLTTASTSRRGSILLSFLVVAYIVSYLDRQVLPLIIDPIRTDLHISDLQIGLLQGFAFVLFFAFAGIPIGRLVDRLNRIRIIAAAIFLWSTMTVACGFSNSFWTLFLARVGLGIGEAALAPAGFSLLADSYPPKRLVRAVAVFTLGGLLGAGLAYFVGGFLFQYLNNHPRPVSIGDLQPWQMTFVLISVPGFLLAPLLLMIREPERLNNCFEKKTNLRDTVAYLYTHRQHYAPFFICAPLLAVPIQAGNLWMPAHMMRKFEMAPAVTGLWLGSIQLAASVIGTLLGAFVTEYFQDAGYKNAHLRTVAFASAGATFGMLAPLMPDVEWTLIVWTFAVACLGSYFGSLVAVIQVMTPNSMRGSTSGLLLMIQAIVGLGGGTALVGAVSDSAFAGNPSGAGISLALVGAAATLVSALVATLGVRRSFATP